MLEIVKYSLVKAWREIVSISAKNNQADTLIKLALVSILTITLFSIPIYAGYHLRAWDAFTHIFFAHGYANDWWGTWDVRWYGGYDKTSYPPLAHQLTALMMLLGIRSEMAYLIVLLIFLVMGPIAAFLFSSPIIGRNGAVMAAFLLAFMPSIRVTLFSQGQFAGYVSVVFTMLAAGATGRYLRSGRAFMGLSAALLAACSIVSHTATNVFFLPLLLLTMIFAMGWHMERDLLFQRLMSLTGFFIIIIVIITFPFWQWLFDFNMQVPIPHPSRSNLLRDLSDGRSFFLNYYGPVLVVFVISLLVVVRSRRFDLIAMGSVGFIFVLLGMGGTTILPAVLFGEQWQWLTYERFNLWATIFMLPVLASFLTSRQSSVAGIVSEISLILLVIGAALWTVNPESTLATANPVDMDAIILHLNKNPNCRERFLAFGFSNQLPQFSIGTGARTLDGLWHTVRRDPLLRESGIGAISDALYWETGEKTLREFLERDFPVPANCIYLNEHTYNVWLYREIMRDNGWELDRIMENDVSVWKNDLVNTISESSTVLDSSSDRKDYVWGLMPVAILLSTLSTIFLDRWTR